MNHRLRCPLSIPGIFHPWPQWMRRLSVLLPFLLPFLLLTALPAWPAPDADRQAMTWLRSGPAATDLQVLAVDDKEIPALWREDRHGVAHGTVILLPDERAHADWHAVIGPLRRALPTYGWHTLAVQPAAPARSSTERPENSPDAVQAAEQDADQTQEKPDAAKQAGAEKEAAARLAAAVRFAVDRDSQRVILLGHGRGAVTALQYAAAHDAHIDGVILIGMPPLPEGVDFNALLAETTLPVFDLYGTAAALEVRQAAQARLAAGRRVQREEGVQESRYRQHAASAANHDFSLHREELIQRVRGWLQSASRWLDEQRPLEKH